ncbi:hypothetical protein BSKO_14157 [Bryopsis sp. KO-2023]|nr:hypothetical protein BSKO_14157 [Bryopsis sp. KO-2023]
MYSGALTAGLRVVVSAAWAPGAFNATRIETLVDAWENNHADVGAIIIVRTNTLQGDKNIVNRRPGGEEAFVQTAPGQFDFFVTREVLEDTDECMNEHDVHAVVIDDDVRDYLGVAVKKCTMPYVYNVATVMSYLNSGHHCTAFGFDGTIGRIGSAMGRDVGRER